MANLTVAGFGDINANGTYIESGTQNGYAFYRKNANYTIIYCSSYMPYSNAAGYYIVRKSSLTGREVVTQVIPCYSVLGTDPTASGWINMRPQYSGEEQVGIVS